MPRPILAQAAPSCWSSRSTPCLPRRRCWGTTVSRTATKKTYCNKPSYEHIGTRSICIRPHPAARIAAMRMRRLCAVPEPQVFLVMGTPEQPGPSNARAWLMRAARALIGESGSVQGRLAGDRRSAHNRIRRDAPCRSLECRQNPRQETLFATLLRRRCADLLSHSSVPSLRDLQHRSCRPLKKWRARLSKQGGERLCLQSARITRSWSTT